MLMRNTASLDNINIFKPVSTTIEAADILATQLATYENLLRSLQSPYLLEALRENDLKQTRLILVAMTSQLDDWLKLPKT